MKYIISTLALSLLSSAGCADHIDASDAWSTHVIVESTPSPNDCDLQTARSLDPYRTVEHGVDFGQMNAKTALAACEPHAQVAFSALPEGTWAIKGEDRYAIRAIYQYARALSKAGRDYDSFLVNEEAAKRGYPFAHYYKYQIFANGWGVDIDRVKALESLDEAVRLDVPIAFVQRADEAMKESLLKIDFNAVALDIAKAETEQVDTARTWGRYYEKLAEYTLVAGCVKSLIGCPKEVKDMAKVDFVIHFGELELINYSQGLQTARRFFQIYADGHPGNDYSVDKVKTLTLQIDRIEDVISDKMDFRYVE